MPRQWILATGPAHSGTRLLVDVLGRHPEIAVPDDDHLTVAREYPWLHNLFLDSVRDMGLHEERIPVDPDELAFVLDAYAEAAPEGRYVLVKLPHAPLLAREAFEQAVDLEAVAYTTRSADKIRASKEKRGKDIRVLEDRERFLLQAKRCMVEERKRLLNAWDFETMHEAEMRTFETLIERWADEEGPPTVTEMTQETFVEDPARLEAFLGGLGLDSDEVDRMTAVVDADRLQQRGLVYQLKENVLRGKNRLRARLEERA